MHIDAVLRKLGELERSLADLYGLWSEVFAADEEAATVRDINGLAWGRFS